MWDFNSFASNAQHFPVACVLLFLLFNFLPALSRISGNSKQKVVLQISEQPIQYTSFRDSFPALKVHRYDCYQDRQEFEQFSIPIQAPNNTWRFTVCWCKQLSSISLKTCLYCMYLVKLYDKSIIILLTCDLTNVCSEISKIRLILLYLLCERVGGSWKVG